MIHTTIRKMGNSQGIIIPKPLLSQIGLKDEVEMSIENGAIILRPPRSKVREGWALASQAIAAAEEEAVWPEFHHLEDKDLEW